MEAELRKLDFPQEKIVRWPATYHVNGALGCSKSHCAVLRYVMSLPEIIRTIIVLEDDFEFIEDDEVKKSIDKFLKYPRSLWDIMMLGYAVYRKKCYDDFVSITMGSWLVSGYMIQRHAVPALLANFEESCEGLEKTGEEQYRLDVYWEKIMRNGRCFFFNKALGGQRPSYSDITYQMAHRPSALSDYVEVVPASTNENLLK